MFRQPSVADTTVLHGGVESTTLAFLALLYLFLYCDDTKQSLIFVLPCRLSGLILKLSTWPSSLFRHYGYSRVLVDLRFLLHLELMPDIVRAQMYVLVGLKAILDPRPEVDVSSVTYLPR